VLYIDGEMAAVDIRERLRLLGPAPPTLKFLIADLGMQSLPDLGYYEGQGRLQQSWGNPELVVLDNLSSLAGFKTGDPDCWSELQRFLMHQRRSGRAVLVLHHANKRGEQRGTNRREDATAMLTGNLRSCLNRFVTRVRSREEPRFSNRLGGSWTKPTVQSCPVRQPVNEKTIGTRAACRAP